MIISLTTIPSRIEHTQNTIDSLSNQGVPIHLWLPKYVAKTDSHFTENDIPAWMDKYQNLNIEFVEDYGSITKLLPALLNNVSDEIITVDDDCLYPEHFVETLANWYEKFNKQKCICYRGKVLVSKKYNHSFSFRNVKRPTVVDIITGVYGVMYNKSWFNTDTLIEDSSHFKGNDDIIISGNLAKNNIERVAVPFWGDETVIDEDETSTIDSLWWGQNKHTNMNDKALEHMKMVKLQNTYWGRLLKFNPLLKPSK